MVGHVGAHDHPRLPASLPRGRVVDRFEKAKPADETLGSKALQIKAGLLGSDHQRQRRGIGRDDQILGQPALESEARHAEGAVLVEMCIRDRSSRCSSTSRGAAWSSAIASCNWSRKRKAPPDW